MSFILKLIRLIKSNDDFEDFDNKNILSFTLSQVLKIFMLSLYMWPKRITKKKKRIQSLAE